MNWLVRGGLDNHGPTKSPKLVKKVPLFVANFGENHFEVLEFLLEV